MVMGTYHGVVLVFVDVDVDIFVRLRLSPFILS